MAKSSTSKSKTQEPAKKAKAQGASRGKNKNATDPLNIIQGLSEAQQVALFSSLQKEISMKKRTIDESEEQAVRAANEALMEREAENDSEDDDMLAPPPKKRLRSDVLSDNEQELANSLPPIAKANNRNKKNLDLDHEEEEHNESEGEKDPDFDVNLDSPEETDPQEADSSRVKQWNSTVGKGNGIIVEDKDDTKSVASRARSSYSHSSRSATPGLYPSKSTKVTESSFDHDIRELAIAAKTHARTITSHENPFPPSDQNSRLLFIWKIITDAAKNSGSPKMKNAATRASNSVDIKKNLMTFAMYGRTALIGSIISRARSIVKSHYGLQGSAVEISSDVKWLLEKAHFIFGDLNVKDRKFNKCKPFLNDLIIDIIENQWTPSSSRAKSDSEATARILKEENIPSTMILLVTTAIEHALKEWADGQTAAHIQFSDESARLSYMRHLDSWNATAKNTKVYVNYCRKTIYKTIMKRHQAFMNAQGDIEDLDFSEMDRIAQEQMDAVDD